MNKYHNVNHSSLLSKFITTKNLYISVVLLLFVVLGIVGVSLRPFLLLGFALLGLFGCVFLLDVRKAIIILLIMRSSIDLFQAKAIFYFGTYPINLAGVLSLVAIGLGFVYLIVNRVRVLHIPLVRPYLLFLLVCFISLLFAPNKVLAIRAMLRFSSIFIVYILVFDIIRSKEHIMNITKYLLLALAIPLAMGLYQIVTKRYWIDPLWYGISGRIQGSFIHPGVFGEFIMIFLCLVVFRFLLCRSGVKKSILGGLLLVMMFCLFHTSARAAWIGTLIMFTVLGFVEYRRVLFGIALFIVAVLLFSPTVSEKFAEIPMMFKNFDAKSAWFTPTAKAASFQWRVWHWYKTFEKAMSNKSLFMHGYGIGNFPVFSTSYKTNPFANRGLEAHNDYIRVVVEAGLMGLLVYVWILYRIFSLSVRLYKRIVDIHLKRFVLVFLSLFVALVAVSMSNDVMSVPVFQWYFWVLVALVCSVHVRGESWRPYTPNTERTT